MRFLSLFELHEFLRRVVHLNFTEPLWVKAEVVSMRESRGHRYFELIEKSGVDQGVIAQGNAVLWKKTYRKLSKLYKKELPHLLQDGIEILISVEVDFHEVYGFKLIICDIDPSYTLGQLEMQRRATLLRLQKENLLDKNKLLSFPIVPQRIAVISAVTAAGFADFTQHLMDNQFGYSFHCQLFPAAMQGERAPIEITTQLKIIAKEKKQFDAITIIRGGGAKFGLNAFDDYNLAKAIAKSPLPIITGIGHEIDESVVDQVAYHSMRTPTAVADFFIQKTLDYEQYLLQLGDILQQQLSSCIKQEEQQLQLLQSQIESHCRQQISLQHRMLEYLQNIVPQIWKSKASQEHLTLNYLEKSLYQLHPNKLLARGYAIVYKDGKPVNSKEGLAAGDELVVRLRDGEVDTEVK